MKKTYITVLSIVVLTVGIVGFYYVNKYNKEIDFIDEQADFTVTANDITKEFIDSPKSANKKYVTKVVIIQGLVTELHGDEVIVDNKIVCTLKTPNQDVHPNQLIVIKGRIVGYDDFMGELRLDNCFKM